MSRRDRRPTFPRTGAAPATCLVRGLEPDEIDAMLSRQPSPIRLGGDSPWAACLKAIRLGSHSRLHDKTSPLAAGLLGFGGASMVNRGEDPDMPAILARGQLWPGDDALSVPGRVSNCHGNAAVIWEARQDVVALATGYALSEDGLWRQHSWCVIHGAEPTVAETTVRRLLYFGFAMTAEESVAFHLSNADGMPRLAPAPTRPDPDFASAPPGP